MLTNHLYTSFGVMFTSFALLLIGAIFVFLLMSTNRQNHFKRSFITWEYYPNIWKIENIQNLDDNLEITHHFPVRGFWSEKHVRAWSWILSASWCQSPPLPSCGHPQPPPDPGSLSSDDHSFLGTGVPMAAREAVSEPPMQIFSPSVLGASPSMGKLSPASWGEPWDRHRNQFL